MDFISKLPIMAHAIDDKGLLINVSDFWLNKMGYESKEVIGLSSLDFLTAESIRYAKHTALPEFFKKGTIENVPYQFIKKDKTIIDVLLSASSILDEDGSFVCSLATIIDVTEKTQTENQLKEIQERYELAMEASQDGLYDWNLMTNEIYYSPGWKSILGYQVDELPNDFSVWEKLTDPEDVGKSWKMQQDLVNRKRDRFELEFKMKHKDGHWVNILSRATAVFDNDSGKAVRVVGTHVDITERKKYLKQLKILNSAIENSLNGFDIVNAEGVLIYANKAFVKMYGFDSADEIIGTSPSDLCADSRIPEKLIQKLQEDGEYEFEHVAKKRDGSTFDVLMHATLAHDEQGNEIYPTSCIDITVRNKSQREKEELEKQLKQSQKLESIGTLAGGIAHEFNNMLAIIMGNNELIMDEVPEGSLAKESTEEIRSAGIRAREVVKQLLTYSRQDNAVKKIMDFKFVVQESMKLIRSSTPANIQIEQNISADTYPVVGNDTQINQLLINLCNNAVHALPEKGGRISIELLNETIDRKQDKPQTKLPPGQYAKLTVSDNGIGMDGEILDRVFEPYFTTKDVGEGTGIGMAVVHGIVARHGGVITVDSKPDQGTSFTIFLPAHEGLLEQETDKQDILPVGDEYILYVDDEPSIALLGKRLLESLGYRTESITNPEEALDMVRSDPNRFDLLITDMAMPDMTGDQLITETLKIRQDMPTIICTGYSSKISEKEAAGIGVHSYIMKPINKSELAKLVRKVLDGAERFKS